MTDSVPETVDRNTLIERHTELVKYLARRIGRDLPPWMERDDLISFGWFGLIDAAERFDPARGVKFETFATPRIRGSILDGLRSTDWAPRSVRSANRAIETAAQALSHDLGREPTLTELSEHLGLAPSEIQQARWEGTQSHVQALESGGGDDDSGDWNDPVHAPSSDLAGDIEQSRMRRLISEAIVGLPEPYRQVVALKYGEQLKLPEVGRRMGHGRGKATALYVDACMLVRERLALLT